MASFHGLDDAAGLVCLLDRQELSLTVRRNEGQHHHVGVGIQEDVLDERVRSTKPNLSEPVLAHEMSLHIEYELSAFEAFSRRIDVEGCDLREVEETAGPSCVGIRAVEGEQCRGRSG